jgi:amino acid adenylation domain-containing protein
VQRLSSEEAQRPFDLARGPLLRASLLKLAPQEHVLLLTVHHIVSDGWSLGVLNRELGALYGAYSQGRPSPLPELPVQYADYAIWQRQWLQGKVLQNQLQYWSERLSGAPPQLQLPTDRPRPAVASFKGAVLGFELPAALCGALEELARQEGATLFMVVLAAYQVLLSRYSGEQDVVVGSPIAGRTHAQTEGLIGFFVNMLTLRTDLSGNPNFRQLVGRVKEVTLGAYAHQDLPFEKLVMELRPERNLTRQPIFQVALALRNFPQEQLELAGLTWTQIYPEHVTALFDLTLHLLEVPDGLHGIFEYTTDLFDRGTIERMATCFEVLLKGMVTDIQQPINQLSILPESERHQVIDLFNATQAAYAQEKLIHELFEEQVERTPDAVAVIYDEQCLTYAELNGRANQLARYLRNRGVGPDQLVGIYVERSLEMVVGLLGILKAGGAYVPLDLNYPTERLQYMLKNAAPRVLLTQERLKTVLLPMATGVIALDGDWSEIAEWEDGNLDSRSLQLTSRHLAYVIYTSGSTGDPKGVMVEHAGVVNFLTSMQQNPGISATDRMLAVTTVSFDIAALEIYLPLVNGAKLVLASREAASDAQLLMAMLEEFDISVLQATPATWQLLLSGGWGGRSNLKALCGGESLTTDLSGKLVSRVGALWNLYGPTETTIWSCGRQIAVVPDERGSVESIGRPISNTQIYILDRQQRAVPIGVVGEIYIGGAGVARGYLNRPELTAERFVADPFSGAHQARMYKTGDLGRWQSDGTIEYLGRNDDQVKIRGYRIELGEIEAQLTRHDQVKEAVVVAREHVPGEKRLVAYLIPKDPFAVETTPSAEALRTHLKAVLPEYMVPSAFVMLERFPLTPNGKLDRRALPAPELGAYASGQYEAPQGDVEEVLAGVWQELLRVERIGRQDNFFELGGHSLHGMKLIAKVAERFMVGLSVIAVFQYPTIQQMAKVVESLRVVSGEPLNSEEMEFEEGVI